MSPCEIVDLDCEDGGGEGECVREGGGKGYRVSSLALPPHTQVAPGGEQHRPPQQEFGATIKLIIWGTHLENSFG